MEVTDTHKLLLAAVEHSDDAIITKTLDGIVTTWNRAAERIFEFAESEAVGRPIFIIVPADRLDEERDILRRLNEGIRVDHFETIRKTKSGRLVDISLSVSPVRSPNGKIIGATKIVRDITKQKESDRILRQAQKMEAIGQLTGGVAHDFNNILAVILGTIELLGEEVRDRRDLSTIVAMIDAAATRGAELTARLLAFARKQPLSPISVDINTLVKETIGLLRHAIPESIEITADLKPKIAPALVDPDQLMIALLNLAVNARDAMPDGGRLLIRTSDVDFDEDYLSDNYDIPTSPHLMIAISDNGCGIPEDIRDKIFEPFFTTKGLGKGTGLGLSMVYGFVNQSQGSIKVRSEVDVGTTFKLFLPKADIPAPQFSNKNFNEISKGDERVLVVEDDDLVRETIRRQLTALGYDVHTVANASDALAFLKDDHKIALLLTDIILTGLLNGKQLADEAIKENPALRVVFMSGYSDDWIARDGQLDDGVLFLSKPFRTKDLARVLRRAIDHQIH